MQNLPTTDTAVANQATTAASIGVAFFFPVTWADQDQTWAQSTKSWLELTDRTLITNL